MTLAGIRPAADDAMEAEVVLPRPPLAPSLALLVVALVAGWWWGTRSPEPLPVQDIAPLAQMAPVEVGTITVHVAGWVAHPGLVELEEGARVADAVVAAGGLLPGARADNLNLAQPVSDGEQVMVPGPSSPSTGIEPIADDGRVHLNRATASDLEALPGVGPVLAARIVTFREENGPFETIEDLLEVPGIGEAKLSGFRDLLVVP
ncbi:MAG TPA: ComEA family DNA-binding protein [Acidimicrobiia bacterium]